MIALAKIARKDGGVDDVPVFSVQEFRSTFNADAALARIVYSNRNSRATKAIEYINIPAAFDIEWSSVPMDTDPDDMFSFMYVWQFCIGHTVVAGRTWEEFTELLRFLKQSLLLHSQRRFRIYVHFLSAEWQFLHYRLPTRRLFCRNVRQPIEWVLDGEYLGIEFRCSYILTNNSLERWAADEPLCPYGKQVGSLDYSIVRTPSTPLTDGEWGYCAADVLTLCYCLSAMIGREWRHSIDSLPLTKTGFVRRSMRRSFGNTPVWRRYEKRVRLNAKEFVLYYQAMRGGDCHAHAINAGVVWPDVWSYDITSSFPYQLIAREYPASAPVWIADPSVGEFNWVLSHKDFLWIAKLQLVNLQLKSPSHYTTVPLSLSTAHVAEGLELDNGRVVYCRAIEIPMFSTDWAIMTENYTFEVAGVRELLYHAEKALLPECFRRFILGLYADKTELKNVTDDEIPGAENRYRLAKADINSSYGATITSPLNNEVRFDLDAGEWIDAVLLVNGSNLGKIQHELDKVHRSRNHFLPYCIGGWVAAYGRLHLYEALRGLRHGAKAVYWDTDSVYYNAPDGRKVFEKMNAEIDKHLRGLYNEDEIAPKDRKGRRHMIGLWDPQFDGDSVRFITFGAKKYFYTDRAGVNHVTVAGLNKKKGAEYLTIESGGSIVDGKPIGGRFCDTIKIGFRWPEEWSGRSVVQYSEKEHTQIVRGEPITEKSWVAIIPSTYELGWTEEYALRHLSMVEYRMEER